MNDYLINKKLSSSKIMDYILPHPLVGSENRIEGEWRICGINMSTRKYLCAQTNSSCSPLFEPPRMIYRDKISEEAEFFVLPRYRGKYITNTCVMVEEDDFLLYGITNLEVVDVDW